MVALPQRKVTLEDKYELEEGRVFLTGIQALVRLPMMQRQRDLAAGLNTGGFISGYRGSPLGGLDMNLWRAEKYLERHHIKFEPGVNEDLAMTSVWGSQQLPLFPDAACDGVFAMWYGKGPGVDRCGDVLKHGNAAGSSKYGGVLICAGDDHGASSSTLPHQSDHMFMAAMVPVLYPANVQEMLDYGLLGWAMSRYTGAWGRLQVGRRGGGKRRFGLGFAGPGAHRLPERVHPAAGRAEHPLAGRYPRAGRQAAAATNPMPRSPSPGPTGSTG